MKRDRAVTATGAAGVVGTLTVERFPANGEIVVATDTGEALGPMLESSR